ncbi:MAG: hypothetical protein DMF62_06295 [Acidobacteria bacterium]|nr:MAG: hypothetical protein DMF62_06295 [Acidobacteriota bacterium]
MEPSENLIGLGTLPLGARLLFRSRSDWRSAVISRKTDDGVTLSVASPKGRNYRLRRDPESAVGIADGLHFLHSQASDVWTDNFASYDSRW